MNVPTLQASQPGEVIAELDSVVKRYGKVTALDGVSLALRAGEVTALLGPNGAGKTTAVKLLLGLLAPDGGKARLFGLSPTSAAARTRVGAMMQVSKVPETLRVREHLDLFSAYYPRPLPLAEVLATIGLEDLAERPYGKLSGGEKQRLALGLAICGDPDLLFLDEPTVGLDVEARRTLWSEIRRLATAGRTILLTTHYLEEADALADRVVVLAAGRILADGTTSEIKARSAARRVRCRTRLATAEILRLPGVADARRDRGLVEIFTAEAEVVVRALLAGDPGLADLEVTTAGLVEAFLNLTSGHRVAEARELKGAA